jgi:ABC-type transport system substrate-binding protein
MKPIVKTIVLGALSAAVPLLALLPSVAAAQPAAAPAAAAPGPARVLRLALASRENNLDPAQVSDVISSALVASLFDAPLTYDHLARPAKLKPNTATSLPEVHDDNTRFVFRIRPGIHFADDPAFKGHKRELTAADYVYSVKRFYDPATRSPTLFHYENAGLLGLSELRKVAIATGTPFPYDTEVAGIRALDRYTFEVRTSRPAPRLPYVFATPPISGAVAREVIEAAAGKTMERPVGTGPFRLAEWKRRSRIVLERNPNHRSVYDEAPDPSDPSVDAATRELALRLRGRPMPLVDRLEFAIIEEGQSRSSRRPVGRSRPTWPRPACGCTGRCSRSRCTPISARNTRCSAASRRHRWRCGVRWHSPTTCRARWS